jgi:Methyltransferase domain
VRPLLDTWLAAARLRRRAQRRRDPLPPREDLIRRHAPGRSFLDVGCMWSVDGAIAFLAEESGATAVTGIDLMPPTRAYQAEHARRDSKMRFVPGDVHDPAVVEQAGVHDVVWCSGVLYHVPHPLLTLERLRSLTRETLILATEAIPEVPGAPGAALFYPALDAAARKRFAARGVGGRTGLDTPFDPAAAYANWFWGLTPSALRGLLDVAGFDVVDAVEEPFHSTLIATPRG